MANLKDKQCNCDPQPFLIFDKDEESPEKDKIRQFWKTFQKSNAEVPHDAPSESEEAIREGLEEDEDLGEVEDQYQEEEDLAYEEDTEQDDRTIWAGEIFEKMLALRIDQHALAIKDGYRIRPQVCICDDECCSCFDYSPFLHNLKLHNYQKLLAREYDRMTESQKQHAAFEGDSGMRAGGSSISDGISVTGLFQSKLARTGTKQNDPPYESTFNSTHGRLRQFDANLYKYLVRKETRKYSDKRPSRPENQTRKLAVRPTWRI